MITDGDYSRPERAINGRPGIISQEFKRDIYENEKDLAFAKSSSLRVMSNSVCSKNNSIYPWRIIGSTSEHSHNILSGGADGSRTRVQK